jgi:hypothetical protein
VWGMGVSAALGLGTGRDYKGSLEIQGVPPYPPGWSCMHVRLRRVTSFEF